MVHVQEHIPIKAGNYFSQLEKNHLCGHLGEHYTRNIHELKVLTAKISEEFQLFKP